MNHSKPENNPGGGNRPQPVPYIEIEAVKSKIQ
jgi:hypothetical protein